MSKYNKFAKQLDEAFRAARDEYNAVADRYEAAEKAVDAARYKGEVERVVANAEYKAASEELRHCNAWEHFYSKADALKRELHAEVGQGETVSAAAIDTNALELLKSGVMRAADFAAMAKEFEGNATMCRLIRRYAEDASEKDMDKYERAALYNVINNTLDGMDIEKGFENLCSVARTYSGASGSLMQTGYRKSISEKWDDETITAFVEDF